MPMPMPIGFTSNTQQIFSLCGCACITFYTRMSIINLDHLSYFDNSISIYHAFGNAVITNLINITRMQDLLVSPYLIYI